MSKAPAGPAGVLRSAFRQLLAGSPRNLVRPDRMGREEGELKVLLVV